MTMEITEFLGSDSKERLLAELKKCEWEAGKWLYELLKNGETEKYIGDDPKVFMLTDGDKLVSFCTLAKKDDIPDTELTPWIGFVYTFPEYRGRRLAGKLLSHAENEARSSGYAQVYISTDHVGLYEKYGYTLCGTAKDVSGNKSRIYTKKLRYAMNADTTRNREYYKTAEPCQCEVCRYFCRNIRKALPEVADYLDTLNVDIEKPFELVWTDCNDDGHIDFIGCQYIVFGSCEDDFRLKIGDTEFINNKTMHPSTGLEEAHFVLDFGEVAMDMKEK